MPLTYAGSVSCVEDAKKIISCGIERIAVGVYSQLNVCLVDEISTYLGKSGVCSILNIATYGKFQLLYDYKKRRPRFRYKLSEAVRDLNNSSTGEVILVDVMNEGTRSGFSLQCLMPLFRKDIPLMAYGGISSYDEVDALWLSGFTGVAASALLTLRPPFDSVMISYPDFKTRCRVQNLTQPQISIDRYDKLV
jgi:cyclase